jgi:chorismate mutase
MSNQSDRTDLHRVTEKFDQLTQQILQSFHRRLELARAENDEAAVIKEQIKIEVLKATRGLYAGAYRHVTRQRPWLEEKHR